MRYEWSTTETIIIAIVIGGMAIGFFGKLSIPY